MNNFPKFFFIYLSILLFSLPSKTVFHILLKKTYVGTKNQNILRLKGLIKYNGAKVIVTLFEVIIDFFPHVIHFWNRHFPEVIHREKMSERHWQGPQTGLALTSSLIKTIGLACQPEKTRMMVSIPYLAMENFESRTSPKIWSELRPEYISRWDGRDQPLPRALYYDIPDRTDRDFAKRPSGFQTWRRQANTHLLGQQECVASVWKLPNKIWTGIGL